MIECCKHTRLSVLAAADPTRTTTLRQRFANQMNAWWHRIIRDIRTSIVDNDCFGIQADHGERRVFPIGTLEAVPPLRFRFETDREKLAGFVTWLQQQEEQGILQIMTVMHEDVPWTNTYIDTAYQQGIRRARQELRAAGYQVPTLEHIPGGISAVMNQPIHAKRLELIYERTFDDLKTVTEITNARIRQRLIDGLTTGLTRGLAEGKNPKRIAAELAQELNGRIQAVGMVRARTIARSEIIRAHHLANIEEYRQAEVEGVKVDAEWLTAGDSRVCAECASLEGKVFTLEEIEGLIPYHPNCRCVARPVPKEEKRE